MEKAGSKPAFFHARQLHECIQMDTFDLMEYQVEQTDVFAKWHARLKNLRARIAIARRIERAAAGNLGDVKSVGSGVSEMRVDTGPGYRVYFTRRRDVVIILLLRWRKAKPKSQYPESSKNGCRDRMMNTKRTHFDMTKHLDSPDAVAEYLDQVLADNDTDELVRALGHIAKARGMTQLARDAGLGRESLYKALAPGAKPRAETLLKVIRALGVQLHAA